MSDVCPCCGQQLPYKIDIGVKLSPGARRILEIVHKAGERGIESNRLFHLLYGDDPNGGPDTGVNTLHVRVWHLNKRLKEVGWRIKGQHGCYRLVKLEENVV